MVVQILVGYCMMILERNHRSYNAVKPTPKYCDNAYILLLLRRGQWSALTMQRSLLGMVQRVANLDTYETTTAWLSFWPNEGVANLSICHCSKLACAHQKGICTSWSINTMRSM